MTLLDDLDQLLAILKNTRAYFPFMPDELIGQKNISTGQLYANSGFPVSLVFGKPLTKEDINKNNEIANWINQNFVVRLYATIEENLDLYKKTLKTELKGIEGKEEIILLRELRHIFAHSGSGSFNSGDSDHVKVKGMIEKLLGVKGIDKGRFNLDIGKVLIPLFNKARKYIELTLN